MKVVVQRVSEASVKIGGNVVGQIGKGYLLLVGFTHTDTEETTRYLANKILKLRVFPDLSGKLNLSIQDVGGNILSVSQFTLYGDTSDGNRPSFTQAMNPTSAKSLYERFNRILEELLGKKIETGQFQEEMAVSLVNDGPVTILMERG